MAGMPYYEQAAHAVGAFIDRDQVPGAVQLSAQAKPPAGAHHATVCPFAASAAAATTQPSSKPRSMMAHS